MVVNTLVKHKTLSMGIGCIAKVYKKHYTVNWGLDSNSKVLQKDVELIDTSLCPTIKFSKYRNRILMSDPDTKNLDEVILGNVVQHFVGIGWIDRSVVTEEDLKKIPRVVEDEEWNRIK